MKANYTDISIVLDRSGSMESIRQQTIDGFNKFLAEQKFVATDATITLAQFDDVYEVVYHGINLQNAPPLTLNTFVPRGSTALLDAMGQTINETGQRLAAMPEAERPEGVIFVTVTDGEENASRHFTVQQINDLVRHQREIYNWEFVFLGANQDAITTASKLGHSASYALTYAANDDGVQAAFSALTDKVAARRRKEVDKFEFDDADRNKQDEASRKPKQS
jgi:hypothetical protein